MKPEAAQRSINAFERRFDAAHLDFARHAALPLALTPDLLYCLWANFRRDAQGELLNIPWIAVSDLLLSSLCDEVGYELFEMDPGIRQELLMQLKKDRRFGEPRLREVAGFLFKYVNRDGLQAFDRDFVASQSWAALAYTKPSDSVRELATAFNRAFAQNPADLMRLATLTDMIAQPGDEFAKLTIFARALGHYTRRRSLLDIDDQVKDKIEVTINNTLQVGNTSISLSPEIGEWFRLVAKQPRGIKTFEFATAKVNHLGEVISRLRGKAKYFTENLTPYMIANLVHILETSSNEDDRRSAADNLARVDPSNPLVMVFYNHIIEIKRYDHDAWYNRGVVFGSLGRYEEAIVSYEHALESKPDYYQAWYNRGLALENLGRHEEAIVSYEHALKLKPDYHEAWYNLGVKLGILGRYEEAIVYFDKAIEIKPNYYDAWNNRGLALENLGRHEEAITCYDKARKIESGQYGFEKKLDGSVNLEMVYIPGGSFQMGSADGEGDDRERPQHKVTIQPFFMGKFPVTQAQYEAVMGTNPSQFKGAELPVEKVSWDDAVAFCEKLSAQTQKKYRLPSEAEWEYACRAMPSPLLTSSGQPPFSEGEGNNYPPFYFGETITPELVNYNGNYPYGKAPKGLDRQETTGVGIFPPNAFGLYDMHGNVWEWCADSWHDSYQDAPDDGSAWIDNDNHSQCVLRGGSWNDFAIYCRSAGRGRGNAVNRNDNIGFRVVVSGA